jgi:GNAT superfamily N-acetyltransferase
MEDLEIVFDPLPPDPLRQYITDRLSAFGIARSGADAWHPIGFFLKSSEGEWLGGVLGVAWGDWLKWQFLWLDQPARGRRHGTRLMDAAEDYAIRRGCSAATLETHSFEALGFYQKRGYEVFGVLEDYPLGHTKYFLRKRLVQS